MKIILPIYKLHRNYNKLMLALKFMLTAMISQRWQNSSFHIENVKKNNKRLTLRSSDRSCDERHHSRLEPKRKRERLNSCSATMATMNLIGESQPFGNQRNHNKYKPQNICAQKPNETYGLFHRICIIWVFYVPILADLSTANAKMQTLSSRTRRREITR